MRYCRGALLLLCSFAILLGCSPRKSESDLAWETVEEYIADKPKTFLIPSEVSNAFLIVMKSDLETAIPRIVSYRDEDARDRAASALSHLIWTYDESLAVRAVTLICDRGASGDGLWLVQNAIAQSHSDMSQQAKKEATQKVLEFMQSSASPESKADLTHILVFVCETEGCGLVIKEHNKSVYEDWMRMYDQKPD